VIYLIVVIGMIIIDINKIKSIIAITSDYANKFRIIRR